MVLGNIVLSFHSWSSAVAAAIVGYVAVVQIVVVTVAIVGQWFRDRSTPRGAVGGAGGEGRNVEPAAGKLDSTCARLVCRQNIQSHCNHHR